VSKMLPEFERLTQWEQMAKRVVNKYPERYGHVDLSKIAAYVITNKDKIETAYPYEMATDKLPMRLSNPYDYFVWFKTTELWHDKPQNIKVALVVSALSRIDPEKPYAIAPWDYKDQNVMVKTFGPLWSENCDIPNILEDDIIWKE